jgi:hypothetical protein
VQIARNRHYGISFCWIQNWLDESKQRMVLLAYYSNGQLSSGVPLGSELGLLLFLIFIKSG